MEGEKDSSEGKAAGVDLECHPRARADEERQNKEQLRARPGQALPVQLPSGKAAAEESGPGAATEHGDLSFVGGLVVSLLFSFLIVVLQSASVLGIHFSVISLLVDCSLH